MYDILYDTRLDVKWPQAGATAPQVVFHSRCLTVARDTCLALFGVTPTDPLAFGAVVVVLVVTALVACQLPALRATRADPLTALRAE